MSAERAIQKALQDAQSGRIAEAIAALRLHLRLNPRGAEAMAVLGMLLAQDGQLDQAIQQLARAVQLMPNAAGAHSNYANALTAAGRNDEALRHYERALALEPSHRQARLGLVLAATAVGQADRAVAEAERAIAAFPDWPEMAINRAGALMAADRLEDAIAGMERVLALRPAAARMRSELLMALNYTARPAQAVTDAHRAVALGVRGPAQPAETAFDPDRPLRIGILSGDLRTHSVAWFAQAFMRHVPKGWTLVAFSNASDRGTDAMTTRLRGLCAEWVDARPMSDEALDRAIRERKIDVLVELGGHTEGGRLPALDRKPAPVIVTAIGYPNTTGHPAVDWRIVDSITDPPGAEPLCTERLLRIDPCFLCYGAPQDAPEPAMPPADAPFTFGSFNLASKVREDTIALWARAMAAVPGSRLLLKSRTIADPAMRERLLARLTAGGIDPGRVDAIAYTKGVREHLELYARIHVALDTTPYNGTTTTCEALWMGVPVVCTTGDRHAARVGASLLAAAGCTEFLAPDAEGFAGIAAGLAADRERLAGLRGTLRDRLRASPLMDSAAYAERFHRALRLAWAERCAQAPPARP